MTNKSSLLQSKRTKCANLLLLLCCIYLWHNTYQCAALLWMSPLVCLDRFVKVGHLMTWTNMCRVDTDVLFNFGICCNSKIWM